jgi:hypothetical protein
MAETMSQIMKAVVGNGLAFVLPILIKAIIPVTTTIMVILRKCCMLSSLYCYEKTNAQPRIPETFTHIPWTWISATSF